MIEIFTYLQKGVRICFPALFVAFSFERVLKKVKAKSVVGLTATPIRKDGHHPIILMQYGPIRFNVGGKKQAAASAFQYEVIPRLTEFTVPPEWNDIGIQDITPLLRGREQTLVCSRVRQDL